MAGPVGQRERPRYPGMRCKCSDYLTLTSSTSKISVE